eukprot:10466385-Heterocapsa_arctica.AAC.1
MPKEAEKEEGGNARQRRTTRGNQKYGSQAGADSRVAQVLESANARRPYKTEGNAARKAAGSKEHSQAAAREGRENEVASGDEAVHVKKRC